VLSSASTAAAAITSTLCACCCRSSDPEHKEEYGWERDHNREEWLAQFRENVGDDADHWYFLCPGIACITNGFASRLGLRITSANTFGGDSVGTLRGIN
jgi:hypothetical protein